MWNRFNCVQIMLNKEAPCPLGGGLWIVEKRQSEREIKEKNQHNRWFSYRFRYIMLCANGVKGYRQNGAGRRIRTPDLLITNQLLYQLSYTSIESYHVHNGAYYSSRGRLCQQFFEKRGEKE